MPKTILVTGGAGFIGSNFVKYIFENYSDYQIIVLDTLTYAGNIENIAENIKKDSRFSFWYGNIRNGRLVNELISKADTVVHFAAESHVSRSIFNDTTFFETDVLGTQVIANAIVNHLDTIERFIHISTSEVYGTALETPMTEEHPLIPQALMLVLRLVLIGWFILIGLHMAYQRLLLDRSIIMALINIWKRLFHDLSPVLCLMNR